MRTLIKRGLAGRIVRAAPMWVASLLTVALIGLLLLACWAPAILGAPPYDARPRWHFGNHRPPPRHP